MDGAPRVAISRACGNDWIKGQTKMRIERRYTKAGQDAYAEIEFRRATSEYSRRALAALSR